MKRSSSLIQDATKKQRIIPPTSDALIFQQTTIEYNTDKNHKAVISIYGVTEEGGKVLCHVHGFRPYIYFATPENCIEDDINRFKQRLFEHLGDDAGTIEKFETTRRCSIYGYAEESTFIKVTFGNPYKQSKFGNMVDDWPVYESNLDFTLRFMVDMEIVGMNWIELPAGSYITRSDNSSRGLHEVEIQYDQLISHPTEGQWSKIAPLTVLSFDIECTGIEYKENQVIQIANIVNVQGESQPRSRVIFTLGGCSPIEGTEVRSFYSERSLLTAWRDFVIKVNPDIFTGYNINGFDFWFLINRAEVLKLTDFAFFGRNEHKACTVREKTTITRTLGERVYKIAELPGRISLDMYEVICRDYKLPSSSLKAVSEHFLDGDRKIDLQHLEMIALQGKGDDDRRRIAEYCLKDAELPLSLMNKLMVLPNYVEMARVTGVPFTYLLTRGQQIKVLSQIYQRARVSNYVVPVLSKTHEDKYQGATVIEPKCGYYDVPIPTLDFSSLYPSIMIAHNMCYTTLISREKILKYGFIRYKDYIISPDGDAFLVPSKRVGLLPQILDDLLKARKKAKADLKKETDPFKRAILDGRQLALKISANSVYGFTGAQDGYLNCSSIASSVTAYGRLMIDTTIKAVVARYTIANGYEYDAQVVYGDTDSVMITFGPVSLERAMELGKDAAKHITQKFEKPINLEFEKVYWPYLLIGKKRYAGLHWTKLDAYDKVDYKGIDSVRRNVCVFVQKIIQDCLDAILIRRNTDEAKSIVHTAIENILQNKADLKLLALTKGWSKSDYKTAQPHITVAKKMRERDPNLDIGPGSRIAYVITAGTKGSSVSNRAEDLAYVIKHNRPIDKTYYIERIESAVTEIFGTLLKGKKNAHRELFTGKHTKSIVTQVKLPAAFSGFTVEKRCKNCKNPQLKCTCIK